MDGVHPDLVIGPSHRDHRRQRQDPHRRARSTATSTSSARRSSTRRWPPASPRSSAAAPARPRAPRPPRSRPAPWHLARMLEALDAWPVNVAAARQGQHRVATRRCGSSCAAAPAGSSCTRTGARRPPRSTPACGSPTRPACRWRSTPTRSTRPASSSTTLARDRRPVDPRVPHRGRRRRPRARHHHGRRRSPTCCRRRPTRPGRTPSTRSTSTSTC